MLTKVYMTLIQQYILGNKKRKDKKRIKKHKKQKTSYPKECIVVEDYMGDCSSYKIALTRTILNVYDGSQDHHKQSPLTRRLSTHTQEYLPYVSQNSDISPLISAHHFLSLNSYVYFLHMYFFFNYRIYIEASLKVIPQANQEVKLIKIETCGFCDKRFQVIRKKWEK